MGRKSSGTCGDVRQSALWGSGNRGGELRSSALWGKGGRGLLTTALAIALAMPLAASAGGGKDGGGKGGGYDGASDHNSYVSDGLKEKAKKDPKATVSVIITSDSGTMMADKSAKLFGKISKKLNLVDGVVADLPVKYLERLQAIPGLTITENAPVRAQALGYTSTQLWAYESAVHKLWYGPTGATIAIVDSGVDPSVPDLAGRVKESVNLVSTGKPNAAGDGRGHGTFVASIAAGSAPLFAGAAPSSEIVSVDVLDDSGSGTTADVIAGAQWVLANKDRLGIKVANFSLHASNVTHFYNDPLNRAVEKLWQAGVTVVAAAGNYGTGDTPSGVRYAPGSDPFVITVGAADIGRSLSTKDDGTAPWSAWGYTPDGFGKPELCAPGRYMIGAIPMSSTLAVQRADKLVKNRPGYIELSGTSFSAPVVAGIAAQLMARNPSWGPDQVKGALMRSTKPVPQAPGTSCGVGQVNADKAARTTRPPNPNAGLNRFLVTDPVLGTRTFDAIAWTDAIKVDPAWNAIAWSDLIAWSDVSWTTVAWSDLAWSTVAWSDALVSTVAWSDIAWTDMALEDAVESELGVGGYEATPADIAAAASGDPDAVPVEAALAPVAATPAPPVLP